MSEDRKLENLDNVAKDILFKIFDKDVQQDKRLQRPQRKIRIKSQMIYEGSDQLRRTN